MKSRFLRSLWCIFVLTNACALLVAQSTYKRSYDASNDQHVFQTGVTYFVAAIAGNNVNSTVDPNDPCFDISNLVQVVWRPKPEVTLSIQPDACEGDCVDVTATFTGTVPFNFVWQWFSGGNPAGGSTPLSTNQNPVVFNVCPPVGTGLFDFCVLSLQDQYCAAP